MPIAISDAAGPLQLVERGIIKLDDPVTLHVDPLLKRLNGSTLADKFGRNIAKVRIAHLLHMTSGVGDYDRGPYTADQFASPAHDFSPIEILTKYVPAQFDFEVTLGFKPCSFFSVRADPPAPA
jgi:CubicO group peptidase (beta-lactamase class C family)